jgi:uncharacterized damage-inducible protein DinB
MKKTELQEKVREAHTRLTKALEGLSEADATRVGLNANWSVRDALSHIVAWEVEGARIVSEIQAGTWQAQQLDEQGIDDFNARAVSERRARSMREVRDEFDKTHSHMESVIASLPDEIDEASPTYEYIAGVTAWHQASHAAQIEKYRKQGTAVGGQGAEQSK